MPNSTHFARRAAYYRLLAAAAQNEQIAERRLSLANLFLLLSGDLRRIELAAVRETQGRHDRPAGVIQSDASEVPRAAATCARRHGRG
jgi:hypothetical protein